VEQRAAEREPLAPAAGEVAREIALAAGQAADLQGESPPRARGPP
jgi:hypothetical protein